MQHRIFRSQTKKWEVLMTEAAQFGTRLGPEKIVSISHSSDSSDGVITVWYRDDRPSQPGLDLRVALFQSAFSSWSDLFQQAADFVDTIGAQQVLSVSHSSDSSTGVIAVWHWALPEIAGALSMRETPERLEGE